MEGDQSDEIFDEFPSDEEDEIKKLLLTKEKELAKAEIDLIKQEEKINDLNKQIDELHKEILAKDSSLEELNNTIKEYNWQMINKDSRIGDLDSSIKYQQEGQIKYLQDDLNKCMQINSQLRLQLKQKDEEIEIQQQRLEIMKEQERESGRRLPPSESELKMLQEKLVDAHDTIRKLNHKLENANMELEIYKHQANMDEVRKISGSYMEPANSISSAFHDGNYMEELTKEAIKSSKKSFDLSAQLKESESQKKSLMEREKSLEEDLKKMSVDIWLAKERIANQDRELSELHGENGRLKGEIEHLRHQLSTRPVGEISTDKELREALERAYSERDAIREHYNKSEWFLGETKARLGEMEYRYGDAEARRINTQFELDQTRLEINRLGRELDEVRRLKDLTNVSLRDTFLIKRDPMGQREKWKLAMWLYSLLGWKEIYRNEEHSPHDINNYRRIKFEIAAGHSTQAVFLFGSFVNWECGLVCTRTDDGTMFSVSVDLPEGYYEFLFVVDGNWQTSDRYEVVWNNFGKKNNSIYVH
ncbi:unnamed protein product [Dracunculus medinensis]|uniref:AMPK1_CBM domain-containing protein n=1 Tax=Dracunculus medinensis TaxID=318479 RepID=A0A0N4UBB9_DRAME|nr:unnamed protein product [Dracunculus medinensis]